MKKIYLISSLVVAIALVACHKNEDNAIDHSKSVVATQPAPVKNATSSPDPAVSSTVLPMAPMAADCGKSGYNSDSVMCAQAAEQAPAAPSLTKVTGSVATLPDALPPDAVENVNTRLAKLGSLSVSTVNPQGYPVFEMECNAKGQCVNGVGIPMGSVTDVAKQMTTVRQSDIKKYGWKCETFCKDNQGNIIGRPE